MIKPKTTAMLGAILAIAALAAIVAIAPMQEASASFSSNNQQNWQGAFNFNNQQFKSKFKCSGFIACSP